MSKAMRGLVAFALCGTCSAFVQLPSQRAPLGTSLRGQAEQILPTAVEVSEESYDAGSWVRSVLGFGAALGLLAGIVAPMSARAITSEQFEQLTYEQVKGSGLANRCPTVEMEGSAIKVPGGARMKKMCFEPKSFAVEAETKSGKKFVNTRLVTRQTYTLEQIEGQLKSEGGNLTFVEEDGIDFAASTVQLPNGERVPFLFTMKKLVAKGSGSEFKPGFTWGGEYVPSYRTGGFLDPKGRGMYSGYDQAVALPALQADGREGQEELFAETNKVFDIGKGAIEMEVNKVNERLNEIGGVFVTKFPSDTDMGAKAPKTMLLKGIFYGKVV
ncbi:Photosystem II extrinsic oxygen evolving enhancer (psbO) [Amphidinium carterae]